MKGIFLYNKRIVQKKITGIDKKVLWQVEALNRNGCECKLVQLYDSHKYKLGKCLGMIRARMLFGNAEPNIKWKQEYANVDFLYFRRPDAISFAWLKLLNKLKKINPNIKIIMEIPNYPYDDELGLKLINRPLLFKDKIFRKQLKYVVDRVAVQNDVEMIWGIKTIRFTNGINFDEIYERNPIEHNDGVIRIIAVASLEPWQGYERVIDGVSEYYKNGGERQILINIIGSGSEEKFYKRLVYEKKLTKYIRFLGRKSGTDLDRCYDDADLALDAFGRYKTGNFLSTSLKSREYLAKGIPIITGCKTDVLNAGFYGFIEFENNNKVLDFEKIISFYDKIYGGKTKKDVSDDIRRYAKNICDSQVMVQPIIEYLYER